MVYKSTVKSILTYGAETSSIKRKHRRILFATEMDYLRHTAWIPPMERLRNESSTTKMRIKKDILQEIGQQLIWYGHIMRMEDCRISRQVAEWNPQGIRRRGRPIITWNEGIGDSV
jgi:hypothetical protein